jgi:hypothetical protein
MTNRYTISRVEQVVEIATTLSGSWFRGHARIYNELTPKLFRKQWDIVWQFRPILELSLIESFKRGAPALQPSVPNQDNHVAWLFLMQHHGGHTRLLDWTESALIALYFVVSDHETDDGELWAMYPDALNEKSGFHGIPLPNHPILNFFVQEHGHEPKKLAEELGLKEVPNYPLAVTPPMNFARMVAQLSTFTIHPTPKRGNSIPELLPDEQHLVRYIILGSSKEKLRKDLAALGIKRSTLFPDLDSLSLDNIYEHRVVAYSPPAPPRFSD